MDKEGIINELNNQIKIIENFQSMVSENNDLLKSGMPLTFIGGNARKETLRNVIRMMENC